MKKSILIFVSILLLAAGYGFGEVEVAFAPSFGEARTEILTHSFKGKLPNLSVEQADYLAQNICAYTGSHLYLDEQNTVENTQLYRSLDNLEECKINRLTGDIFYRRHVDNEGQTPGLPTKDNSIAAAAAHLETLGLFKDNMDEGLVTTLEEAKFDGQTTEIVEKMRVVVFKRELNGLPVKGASRLVVMMGANGNLGGLFARWLDVQPEGAERKVAQFRVKDYLAAQLKARLDDSVSVLVTRADPVLYDNGLGVIEPALQVQGEITTVDGTYSANWMFPVISDPAAAKFMLNNR
jgi:hypothetical protein